MRSRNQLVEDKLKPRVWNLRLFLWANTKFSNLLSYLILLAPKSTDTFKNIVVKVVLLPDSPVFR